METQNRVILAHLQGEQPMVEARSAIADTFAGRVHVEWDASAPVTPFGQLPFFIDYLKQAGLFDAWVADCPLSLTSPNAPTKRDLLGTVLLSVLAGHRRYAHITTLRCDALTPPLLGMRKVLRVMARAEQSDLAYLFRLRMTANVRRSLERAMQHADWVDAGQGWQGKETSLRLAGWSRQRRIILLRRKLARDVAIADTTNGAQPLLGFAEIGPDQSVWEYAALVTSLDSEILTLGQLYRDRADCENGFDELKNQWGWGGFTTQDLTRCRLFAGMVALIYNWWSLFARLADPEHHREAITARPLLLSAIARKTQHAGQVTLTVSSMHGARDKARRVYVRIAGFLADLRKNAEQLDPLEKWYRILSEALRHFLKGRQLSPPLRLNPG